MLYTESTVTKFIVPIGTTGRHDLCQQYSTWCEEVSLAGAENEIPSSGEKRSAVGRATLDEYRIPNIVLADRIQH